MHKHLNTETATLSPASRARRAMAWLALVIYVGQPLAASAGPTVSVSATYGSSESHSDSTQTSTRTSGSSLNAGGNINLVATQTNPLAPNEGEGGRDRKNAGGNITIQGSDVKAGNNISLYADNTINLLADQNTASQTSHNSSSSNGAGVSASYGGRKKTSGSGLTFDIVDVNCKA